MSFFGPGTKNDKFLVTKKKNHTLQLRIIANSDCKLQFSCRMKSKIWRLSKASEEDIFDMEEHFLDEEKIDGCYYIGLPCLMKSPREWILQISIQPQTMLSHEYADVMRYLIDYSVTRIRNPIMHIMKLDISNTGAYNVVLKTYWLKLIQRTWKRVLKERKQYINNCMNLDLTKKNLSDVNYFLQHLDKKSNERDFVFKN